MRDHLPKAGIVPPENAVKQPAFGEVSEKAPTGN